MQVQNRSRDLLPTTRRQRHRAGFTLVELLIVILIIGLLVSLISAATIRALASANRTRNAAELREISVAIESFKQKYGIYPPSRIKLSETLSYPMSGTAGSLDQISLSTLTRIWPRLAASGGSGATAWTFIDWNGDGVSSPAVILEGDQCLTFFLGGIPSTTGGINAGTGFSTNPQNPAWHIANAGTPTVPPFFEFDSSRLITLTAAHRVSYAAGIPAVSTSHFSYRDSYKLAPYAYFSSGTSRNGYNPLASTLLLGTKSSSDCSSLGVWPYAQSAGSYLNPTTFQIISAGANGHAVGGLAPMWGFGTGWGFGRGSDLNAPTTYGAGTPAAVWTPTIIGSPSATSASWDYGPAGSATGLPFDMSAGLDDQSNFYDVMLGSGS
jgi:general secretion pathway protein G